MSGDVGCAQGFGEGVEILVARSDSMSGDFGCAQRFDEGVEIVGARSDSMKEWRFRCAQRLNEGGWSFWMRVAIR